MEIEGEDGGPTGEDKHLLLFILAVTFQRVLFLGPRHSSWTDGLVDHFRLGVCQPLQTPLCSKQAHLEDGQVLVVSFGVLGVSPLLSLHPTSQATLAANTMKLLS